MTRCSSSIAPVGSARSPLSRTRSIAKQPRLAWTGGCERAVAGRRLIGQVLKQLGVIHEGLVQEALSVQRQRGGRLGEILMSLGHVTRRDLARALAEQAGMPFLDLDKSQPN